MKKTLLFAGLALLSFAPHALAQGFTALAPIPGLTEGGATAIFSENNLAVFFNNLYKYCIGAAATLAVIQIIWAGISISLHQDSVSEVMSAKGKIRQAIFGLILVLSPVLVFSIINPSILNLSLNLPPLDTKTGDIIDTTSSEQASSTAAAVVAGCTVSGTLLKTATCETQQAAEDFAASCKTGSGNVPFSRTDPKATCSTEKGSITGPYSFADISSGIVSTIAGYSNYQPIASTPSNSNNGSAVTQFASSCTADGGTTCMSAVKMPCLSKIVRILDGGSSVSCWNISLSCTEGSVGAGGCSSNPNFTVVQTN